MSFIDFYIKRPVSTLVFYAAIILFGLIALQRLQINLLPQLDYPRLAVLTEYSGIGPREIESLITTHIEAAVGSVSGVRNISSVSRQGISIISIEFSWGTDMNLAYLHIKQKLEEVRPILPEDCPAPQVFELDPSALPIMEIALSAEIPEEDLFALRQSAENLIKPRLEQIEGIAKVDIAGGGERELIIEIDPPSASYYGINLINIDRIINSWNQVGASGTVRKEGARYTANIIAELENIEDFNSIPIRYNINRTILLQDIASVSLQDKMQQGETFSNGHRCLTLRLFREATGNTVSISRRVEQVIEMLEKEHPGFTFHIVRQESVFIQSAIDNLKNALWQGAILAFLVLFIFFQNYKIPVLVVSTIPIAILATFLLMFLSDIQLNIMSLGGLALGIGMFIDNGIIVIENLFRLSEKSKSAMDSAISGVKELMPALTGANLTTMVIFIPVIFLYGISGRLFQDQALTIIFALLVSLFASTTLLPTLYCVFSRKTSVPDGKNMETIEGEKRGVIGFIHLFLSLPFLILKAVFISVYEFFYFLYLVIKIVFAYIRFIFIPVFALFNKAYKGFEKFIFNTELGFLNNKKRTLWLILIMAIILVFSTKFIPLELLPPARTRRFEVEIFSEESLSYRESVEIGHSLQKKYLELDGIRNIYSQFGFSPSVLDVFDSRSVNRIFFMFEADRRQDIPEIQKNVREILNRNNMVKSFNIFPERTTLSEYLTFGEGLSEIRVFYSSLDSAQDAIGKILPVMEDMQGIAEINTNFAMGKDILSVKFKEDIITAYNIDKSNILQFLMICLKGKNAGIFRYLQSSYDIVITSPLRYDGELSEILHYPFSYNNHSYKLQDIVSIEPDDEIMEISREGQERYFSILSALDGKRISQFSSEIQTIIRNMEFEPDIRVVFSGEEEERRRSFKSLYMAMILAVILVYMVMAATFENFIYPLMVMGCIPVSFAGAMLFLLLTGNSLNILSGIGFLVSTGIVVNDAIVKIECANSLKKTGLNSRQSIIKASKMRLRPILLTTLTTILGVLPMVYIWGPGSELQRPIALVIIGSLSFSTIITLILIPVLYEILTDSKDDKYDK